MAKIVVGIDGSEQSKEALRWALEEARLRSAEIVAVHAWEPPLTMAGPGPAPGFELVTVLPQVREAGEQLVRGVVEDVAGGSEVTVEPVAVEGPPVPTLVDAAKDAELLVVGSRGHGSFAALLVGSVSQALAHHAPCPLVIHRTRRD
jgi:nucleotide-binding universal stress UspA family protein